jgi:RHS repeat-associated protein
VQIAPSRGTYEFVWDIFGRRVSNWSASSHTLVESNAYTDSGPIAIRGGGTRIYESQNWLGTERVRTTYNGAVSISIASLPWADQHTPTGDNGDQHDFAGMDRDLEDATEHAQHRQFSTNLGRWLSPDQYLGSYDFSNPQSFNRYSYALNDPANLVDPSGLTITCTTNSDGSRSCIDDQGSNNSDCASNYTACANVPPGCVAYGTEGCITGDNPGSSSPLAPVPTQQSSGGSGSQIGSALSNGTIAAAPKGTKEGYCLDKALLGFGQDLIGYDIASAVVNQLDNWFASAEGLQGASGPSSTQPSLGLPSVPGSSLVTGAEKAGSFVATSAGAQQFIRSLVRSSGGRISVRAVGSKAAAFGEAAGYAGTALTAFGAYEAYQQCIAQ